MTDFATTVKNRRSVRQYLPAPVAPEVIETILEAAQRTPSNSNTQPWQVHILSGEVRDAFSRIALEAYNNGQDSKDFSYDLTDYADAEQERGRAQGAAYYQALGVAREDKEGRQSAARRNLTFFGAPHVALLFAPNVGDNVRVAADIGMYAQTFLLALAANDLAGVPQTMLGSFANQARELLDISNDMNLLFGISFGYPDLDHPAALYDIGRIPTSHTVHHHSTLTSRTQAGVAHDLRHKDDPMDIRDQLDMTLIDLAQVLDGIDRSDDSRPTPCDGLDVAHLRAHVMQALTTFVRGLEHPQGHGAGGPVSVEGRGGDQVRDLARRIVATRDSQPELLYLGGGGLPTEAAFPMMLDEFLAHAWDLAVATGQTFAPDEQACDAATEFLRLRFPTDASRGNIYGPRIEVPDSAPALDRFLGESGRDPRWSAS